MHILRTFLFLLARSRNRARASASGLPGSRDQPVARRHVGRLAWLPADASPEPTLGVEERGPRIDGRLHDAPDDDPVVASLLHSLERALDMGERPVDQRQ